MYEYVCMCLVRALYKWAIPKPLQSSIPCRLPPVVHGSVNIMF